MIKCVTFGSALVFQTLPNTTVIQAVN